MKRLSARDAGLAWAVLTATLVPHLHAAGVRDEEPARLEFRILADRKHDREAAEKAMGAGGLEHPPAGYRWVWLGQTARGLNPQIGSKRLVVRGAGWKAGEFAGATVELTGKNLAGSDLSKEFDVVENSTDTLQLRPDPALYFKSVSSYRIDLSPSRVGESPQDEPVIREVADGPGRVKRQILVKIDRQNVTEKDLKRVVPDSDVQMRPAVRVEFSEAGGRRFGELTRAHLPEAPDGFKYRIGIILDGRLLSAPVLNSEIRESAIIELGKDGQPEEAESIIRILRGSRERR
jgi:SecD/SecF fusion protein